MWLVAIISDRAALEWKLLQGSFYVLALLHILSTKQVSDVTQMIIKAG